MAWNWNFLFKKDVLNEKFYETSFMYRFVTMLLLGMIFRFRFYGAWIIAELSCITATFGAYPTQTNPKPGVGPTNLIEFNNE